MYVHQSKFVLDRIVFGLAYTRALDVYLVLNATIWDFDAMERAWVAWEIIG